MKTSKDWVEVMAEKLMKPLDIDADSWEGLVKWVRKNVDEGDSVEKALERAKKVQRRGGKGILGMVVKELREVRELVAGRLSSVSLEERKKAMKELNNVEHDFVFWANKHWDVLGFVHGEGEIREKYTKVLDGISELKEGLD